MNITFRPAVSDDLENINLLIKQAIIEMETHGIMQLFLQSIKNAIRQSGERELST
ncbi:MAG TPA: hypothetical protein VJZ01_02875 [Lachnospiraceae bacterium]|nr:hypothetical protein [Lachnospiraceae bacterium]